MRADPGEIGRAIMNLSLNARDAMPDGGTLTIETANLTLTEAEAREQDLPPGRYVMLAVRDTGVGMDAEMQDAHLRAVLHDEGDRQGNRPRAWPRFWESSSKAAASSGASPSWARERRFTDLAAGGCRGGATGCAPARGTGHGAQGHRESFCWWRTKMRSACWCGKILETRGYTVIEARNGREGLKLCEAHPGQIDLLVTDVVMPELGGRELAEAALKLRPGLKVMFMSGHTWRR